MFRLLKRKVLLAWIACLAILFNALAPSVSHAMVTASPVSNQIEICTTTGTKVVSSTGSDVTKQPSGSLNTFQHCAYCLTHGGAWALLPQVAAVFAVIDGHDLYPALFYRAPQPLFAWTAANPRAPPTFL